MEEKENVHPNSEQPAADSSTAASKPVKGKKRAASSTSSTSTSPTDESTADTKKRKQSSTAPRTLTKEELADYIARDEFWQKTEAAEGEGDGREYGRGDDTSCDNPVYEDCNEIRRKITAFLKTGRMTQTAWCKLLGVNSGSYQRFMKAKGPYDGSGNGVYPAAAHSFESLRILEHKPKSAKRKREEAAFGKYGRATWQMSDSGWILPSTQTSRDEFGRLRITHIPSYAPPVSTS